MLLLLPAQMQDSMRRLRQYTMTVSLNQRSVVLISDIHHVGIHSYNAHTTRITKSLRVQHYEESELHSSLNPWVCVSSISVGDNYIHMDTQTNICTYKTLVNAFRGNVCQPDNSTLTTWCPTLGHVDCLFQCVKHGTILRMQIHSQTVSFQANSARLMSLCILDAGSCTPGHVSTVPNTASPHVCNLPTPTSSVQKLKQLGCSSVEQLRMLGCKAIHGQDTYYGGRCIPAAAAAVGELPG